MNPFSQIQRKSVWDDQEIESHHNSSDDESENISEKLEWIKMNRKEPNKPFRGLNKAMKTTHYEELQKMLALEQDYNFILDRFHKEKDSVVERVDEEDVLESNELNKQNQILNETIQKMTREIQEQRQMNIDMQKSIETLNQQKLYKRMHLYIQWSKMLRDKAEKAANSNNVYQQTAVPLILSRAVGTPVHVRVPICVSNAGTSNTTTVSSSSSQVVSSTSSTRYSWQETQSSELKEMQQKDMGKQLKKIIDRLNGFLN